MTPVRWTEQAIGDLQAIRAFIERDSPRYGRLSPRGWSKRRRESSCSPGRDGLCPISSVRTSAKIIVGEYRIVYRLEPEVAVLITVFRSSRLFPMHLAGED